MNCDSRKLHEILVLRDGQVVAVIGAGGKHTVMAHLCRELTEFGMTALLTSTTNLHRIENLSDFSTVRAEADDEDGGDGMRRLLGLNRSAVVVGADLSANMFKGIEPQQVQRLRAALPDAVILVKADGARKRLLKAPADHEPVYPPTVDLVILVLSLAAIGKPFDETHVHRLERVRTLTTGDVIGPGTLVDVIRGPGGYAEHLPPAARRVLYLSSCTNEAALADAQLIFQETKYQFDQQIAADTLEGMFYQAEGKSG
jgi:probable selenium-dependent hydroxylase accessory protein YqeC